MHEEVGKQLFGEPGRVFPPLVDRVCLDMQGRCYEFTSLETHEELMKVDFPAAMKVYWDEILGRAHWAAGSSLLRHRTWWQACLNEASAGHFLGYCACLRGMVEAAADSIDALHILSWRFAENYSMLKRALSGRLDGALVSEEVENLTIHFLYARKGRSGELPHPSHKAKLSKEYIEALDKASGGGVTALYSRLCELVHPAAASVHWLASFSHGDVEIRMPDGAELVRMLSETHAKALENVIVFGVNPAFLLLKTLNFFGVAAFYTQSVESICLDNIPRWNNIVRLIGGQSEEDA